MFAVRSDYMMEGTKMHAAVANAASLNEAVNMTMAYLRERGCVCRATFGSEKATIGNSSMIFAEIDTVA